MKSALLYQYQDGTGDLLRLHRHEPDRFPFLLQSAVADAGRHTHARYDILFAFPGETLQLHKNGRLQWPRGVHIDEELQNQVQDDFLSALDARININRRDVPTDNRELPFHGGWFVYLGYELAGQVEPRLHLPQVDDALPVAYACRIPAAIIQDHQENRTILVAETTEYMLLLKDCLAKSAAEHEHAPVSTPIELEEEPATRYLSQIERIKRYIVDGDVFQVNLSRAWRGKTPEGLDSSQLYRRLCQTNPAPFAGLARINNAHIVSSSPERLVRVRDGQVETRPIAGTRPRKQDDDEDHLSRSELMGHPKEQAEHVMLIDLERNDLGRVCVPGSIEVNEMMVLESYAHVHHIVSNVRGRLSPGVTPGQVLRAVFPGGTITGCPKERCMAIIAELEQSGRGAYTGSMGYINHHGDMDLNILIRTISVDDEHITVRAGAGLVADSIAERELEETRHKARGMLLATGGKP